MHSTLNLAANTIHPQRVTRFKVFITGASSGIGQALARHYAAQGAILGLVSRRGELLEVLVRELDCPCAIYAVDVRNSAAMQQAAQAFIAEYGVPDLVIANAGVSRGTLTEQQADIAAFQAVMDTNVMGLVHTFQPFIQPMVQQLGQQLARGLQHQFQLVGIASVAGIRGLPGSGAYSASKAAAIAYLEALRVEMQRLGISVTTIAPGYIRTPMTAVNRYRMPFLIDADVAARKFARAIARKARFVVIPWQMGWVARIMRLIPPLGWDWLASKAPHKARFDLD